MSSVNYSLKHKGVRLISADKARRFTTRKKANKRRDTFMIGTSV